jgi:hypothetical protein
MSATAQIPRPKAMFYFYSPLRTVFQSPTVSDTTSVSTTSTTRVTLKAYTLSLPTGVNTIRVLVYGYVSSYNLYGGRVYVNIDGVDVEERFSIGATEETLLIDYIGRITPGSHTIRIDVMAEPTRTLYITRVFIATGIGLTSTMQTNIISFTVTYQLLRQGNIRYSPGVRVFVFGNRKTTAPMTLTIPEATSVTIGRNNLGAGNDNDKAETILAILTGSIAFQEGGEYTISASLRGAVGASGDVVIVTRILARAQLRREASEVGEVRVYERGVAEYAGMGLLVSVPGGARDTSHYVSVRDIRDGHVVGIMISGAGTRVVLSNYRIAVIAPVHFFLTFSDDPAGESYMEWVRVVVWG